MGTVLRRVVVPSLATVALVGALAGCGSSSDGGSGNGSTGLSGKVAAGGSSAQEKAQGAWRAGFGADNPDVTISYDPVGSGTGRENFISGAFAFAGSDSAMTDDEITQATQTCGGDPVEFPVFISPIDVVFNLSGISKLNLDADTIAKIFKGQITTWNDPAIAAQNDGVDLPNTKITPIHRSDSSGTTDNFTDYLNKAAPKVWTDEHSSDWPTAKGESAEGTTGVVGDAQNGDGTIAYADDSGVQGTNLGIVQLKVGSSYVAPSADGAAAGLTASQPMSGTPSSIIAYNINRTTTDPSTYPLFMASYEIACQKYDDQSTADIVKGFLTYMISEDGQKAAAANAFSAPLPSDIAAKELDIVNQIS